MVIRFSLAALPNGLRVISASLSLYCTLDEYPTVAGGGFIARLTRDWDPAYATWLTADSQTPWTLPGGDFDNSDMRYITRSAGDLVSTWETFDVTDWIRGGLSDSSANKGFLLAVFSGDGHRYASSEYPVMDLRPRLTVVLDSTIGVEKIPAASRAPGILFIDSRRAIVFIDRPGAFSLRITDLNGRAVFSYQGNASAAGQRDIGFDGLSRGTASQIYAAVLVAGRRVSGRLLPNLH